MAFELARLVSLVLHLALFTGIQIVWLFRFQPELDYKPLFGWRLAFAGFFWLTMVQLFDGCPFTHVENLASKAVFGEPFYPDYDRYDTMLYAPFVDEPAEPPATTPEPI